jgi:exodeoxyribonuclease-3
VLRVATHNVNGIRAAVRRGYPAWSTARAADVICLQEVRSPADLIPLEAGEGYHLAYHEGDRAGRNGVAVLTKAEPAKVRVGFGSAEFDVQGRYLEVDLPGVTVASLYLPKGDVYGEKYTVKTRFMAQFADYLERARRRARRGGRELLVCGDFNIAHTELDIKSWKANLKSEGFLPEERAWFGEVTAAGGFVDVIRQLHPDQAGPYSWWSWRGKAFDNDAGWRIDHHWATKGLAAQAVAGGVDRAASYAERISDHAPVVVDYDV